MTQPSGSYRNNTFKMSLTEAVRAHVNHELPDAIKQYTAALSGANNGHAYLAHAIAFLQSQAAGKVKRLPFSEAVRNADKLGFSTELDGISRIIEDPSVRTVYDSYLSAARE